VEEELVASRCRNAEDVVELLSVFQGHGRDLVGLGRPYGSYG
jgi:hypothetical protein